MVRKPAHVRLAPALAELCVLARGRCLGVGAAAAAVAVACRYESALASLLSGLVWSVEQVGCVQFVRR